MKLSASIPSQNSEAKRMAKTEGIPLAEALNKIAKREGFNSWSLLASKADAHEETQRQQLPKTINALSLTGFRESAHQDLRVQSR